MKPEAVAAKIRTNANETLQFAKKGLREVEGKMDTTANLENVTEQIAGVLMRGHESCRKELKEVSELSSTVLEKVPKYLKASEDGDRESILEQITSTESEIENSMERVRGFQRRLQNLSEKIVGA